MKMRNSNYLLGLDLGTTNIKGVVLSGSGKVIASKKTAASYEHGRDSKVEYDAVDYYDAVECSIKNLTEQIIDPKCIKAVSVVSASGNTLLLDDNWKPLRKAISWTDRRFKDEVDIVLEKPDYRHLYETTGWPFYNSFPLAHLSWLKLNEPDSLKAAARVCMVTDYINYRLTGNLATNPSTATTFYLMDQMTSSWSKDITLKLGIEEKSLPKIIKSGGIIGRISKEVSEKTGLKAGIPVIAGSFDHPGAARGTGVLNEGELLLSCGTSWVGLYPLKNRKKLLGMDMLVDPFTHTENCWAGMFSIPSISKNIDKLIRKWIPGESGSYAEFNMLASSAYPCSGGLKINPMADFGRDLNGYPKNNIARAIMEGAAFLMKEKIESCEKAGMVAKRIVMTGGPTQSRVWTQIVCDIIGIGIDVVYSENAGAAGAAVMAGIGCGIYKDESDAWVKRSPEIISFKPDPDTRDIYNR